MKKLLPFIAVCFLCFVPSNAQSLKSAIASIGCKQVKSANLKPMSISAEDAATWQTAFKIKSKESFIAKCKAKDGLFYKFLFEAETFADESDAKKRLPKIGELPPNENSKSDFAVPIILREGFRHKKNIFTVGVFAAMLESNGDVKIIKEKLEKAVKKP